MALVASRSAAGWIAFQTLVQRDVQRFLSVWVQTLLGPVLSSLIFMVVFALIFAGRARFGTLSYEQFLAPGLILMTMMQNAFANSSTVLVSAKMHGSIADLLMAPVTATQVVAALVVGAALRAAVIFSLMGSVLWLAGYFTVANWPLTLLFGLSAAYLFAILGALTGFLCDRWEQTAFVTAIIITPLTMLSGTFYAVSSLPERLQWLAHLNPLFHVVNGFRAGALDYSESPVLVGAIGLPLTNLLLTLLAIHLYRRGIGLRG